MTTFRVHFDGRVLVPDEPVNLPRGKSLVVDVHDTDATPGNGTKTHADLPTFTVPPSAKVFTSEDVRRAEDER